MGGAAIKRLTLAKIKKFRVPVPPLSLQHHFAITVQSIEQQKARMQAHLAELDALFASLQARAFNGEL
jgi:type I restriction enzyme S subunit